MRKRIDEEKDRKGKGKEVKIMKRREKSNSSINSS